LVREKGKPPWGKKIIQISTEPSQKVEGKKKGDRRPVGLAEKIQVWPILGGKWGGGAGGANLINSGRKRRKKIGVKILIMQKVSSGNKNVLGGYLLMSGCTEGRG